MSTVGCLCSLLSLMLLSAPWASPTWSDASQASATPTSLYLAQQPDKQILRPLDPITLSDVTGSTGVKIGGREDTDPYAWILPSADGRTLARVSYLGGSPTQSTPARDITIRMVGVASGAESAPFHLRVPILAQSLTPDGSALYGPRLSPIHRAGSRHAVWYAISTSTGRTIHTVELPDAGTWPVAYDVAGRCLYALDVRPFDKRTRRPQTPALLEYDVRNGKRLGRLALHGVLAGNGDTGEQANGKPLHAQWLPGVALSPDGHRLAVLDGSTNTLRLVDTATLQVVEAVNLSSPASLLERAAAWLDLLPQPAQAKGEEGVILEVSFSSDGRRLYVTGRTGTLDAAGDLTYQDLGMRAVDVATGRIEGQAAGGLPLAFSPDGSELYTLRGTSDGWVLSRDDAATLGVLTQRSFATYPQVVVLPPHT